MTEGTEVPRQRPDAAAIEEGHLRVLRAFTYRARRVECHSIVADSPTFHGYANATMKFEFEGGKSWVVQQFPDEERLESLAARVRPLLLQKEQTHWGRVIGALNNFRGDDPELKEALADLKRRWNRVRPGSDELLSYSAQVIPGRDAPVQGLTDLQLGYAWLYGDLVHGEEWRLEESKSFGREERFRAAVLLICHSAQLTVWTLDTLRKMRLKQLVDIDESYFTEPVENTETESRHEAQIFIAPVGTPPPQPGRPFVGKKTPPGHKS